MHSRSSSTVVCPVCGAELDPAADQCSRCGRTIYADTAPRPSDPKTGKSGQSMIDKPWLVLGLLFFATALCGLPLLWKSRGFSRLSKVILSVVVTLYTMVLLWGFWWIMKWAWFRIVNSLY